MTGTENITTLDETPINDRFIMKKKISIYLALAFLCEVFNLGFALGNLGGDLDAKLAELARQIESNMAEGKKAKIAVIEFSDLNGNITDFGKFLSEELITRLFMTKRFEVIERQLLSKVIAEHKLTLSGFVDPNSAKELGKILGVDAIATGTITDLDATVKINARLITTDTGSIFAVASIEIVKDETIRRLMGKVAQDNKTGRSQQPISSNSQDIFFQEDFSEYELGDVVESWGNNIGVRGNSDFKYITSHAIEAQNEAGTAVDFPADFSFEFYFLRHNFSAMGVSFNFYLVGDSNGDSNIEFRFWTDVVKVNEARMEFPQNNWPEDKWNKIRVVKKGATLKVFINEQLGPSISVSQNTKFSKFHFTWRLSTQWDSLAFAKFLGKKL